MSRAKEHMFNDGELNEWGKLSVAQRLFILEYSRSNDLKKAADAAGYSEKYAARLLENKQIAAIIAENAESSEEILKKRIIDEWASIAFADMGKYLEFSSDADGRAIVELRNSLSCGDTRPICELSQAANGTFKLKLYDKQTALLQLSKLLQLDTESDLAGKEDEKNINIQLKGEVRDWAK